MGDDMSSRRVSGRKNVSHQKQCQALPNNIMTEFLFQLNLSARQLYTYLNLIYGFMKIIKEWQDTVQIVKEWRTTKQTLGTERYLLSLYFIECFY